MSPIEVLQVIAGFIIGATLAKLTLAAIDRRRDRKHAKASHLDDRPETYSSVECYCGDTIPVPVHIEITISDDGEHIYSAEPDIAMIWLHSFDKHPDAHKEDN